MNQHKQRIFNHLCSLLQRLDSDIFASLQTHAGKIIHLEIKGLLSLHLKIQPHTLELLDDNVPPPPHTLLSGRLSDFILASQPNHSGMIREGITLKGDLNCAKAFDECLKHMHLDWEGLLAEKLGDNLALALSTAIKKTSQYAKNMFHHRSADTYYYVQDEIALIPNKTEVHTFYDAITQLKLDVERFEAKLNVK